MNDAAVKPSSPRKIRWAIILAALAAALGLLIAFGVGYWGGQRQLLEKVNQRFVAPALARFQQPGETEEIVWRTTNTHFFPLQIARINLSAGAAIWALEDIGGDILFATRLGAFGYLDRENRVQRIEGLMVPMGVAELTETPLFDDPIFQISELRVLDLLSIPAGENAYDLYVSHHRYRNGCFELVVSRTRLTRGAEGLRPANGEWETLYVTDPCIPVKDIGMRFAGHEGGGRLVRLSADTLLLSIGVHQFDGLHAPTQAGQDESNDLGKIIEISLRTGQHRTYARGFRNPQGLLAASDGRVWESEHGPRGGDEINLIRRGANYGWPIVTYGMDGASPWPFNPNPGQHLGFERPRFSFVPSVGISNLIEPSAEEFPEWSTHILAASLAGNTLFALKTEGDDITYAEPIALGERMRDMIALADGRIAIITDSGVLILIRNGAKHEGAPSSFVVSGLSNRPQLQAAEAAPLTPEVHGARIFFYFCGTCHSVTGDTLSGPPLNDLFGREIGAVEGFPYSDALVSASGRWTPSRLRAFLAHEDARLADTTMPQIQLYKDQFDALTVYLRTTEAAPEQP
ncbi:MAG: PQQ-dependent sugar dehydrogenase [Terricaulis sp.]|nr:PQQ-dependent sugar dehydrogenase [Terricaulis sp.]